MESLSLNTRIDEFLKIPNDDGDGCGDGSGWGDGSGCGDGWGDGSGWGDGWGDGSGWGWGDGDGSGDSDGSGWGDGYGSCSGSDWGDGYGSGCGDAFRYIKSFCGKLVYMIDNVPTIIDRITSGIAKGRILRNDMTTTPCFVVKGGGYFAHGVTLRDAMDALRDKQFDDMPEDERIAEFIAAHEHGKQYPCTDFYHWHHHLTGSCEMGRMEFAKEHGIDVEHDSMTVDEFIDLTRNAYGGTIIKALEKAWETTEAAP